MHGRNLLLLKWLLIPFLSVVCRSLINTGWTPYNIFSASIHPSNFCQKEQFTSPSQRVGEVNGLARDDSRLSDNRVYENAIFFLQYLFCIGKYRLDCRVNLF